MNNGESVSTRAWSLGDAAAKAVGGAAGALAVGAAQRLWSSSPR